MAPVKEVKLLVRNRPLGHYVLSVYSLLFRGYCIDDKNDIITLIAPSRSISRTTDLANLLARVCAPGLLWLSPKRTKISNRGQKTKISNRGQKTKISNGYPKVSNLIVNLTSFDRLRPSNIDIEEGKDFSQEVEKNNARKNFNKNEFGSKKSKYLEEEEYALIEALMVYREKHPNAPREIKKLRKEFKNFLKDKIQEEFFDRVVKATPSQILFKQRAKKSPALQSYVIKKGKAGVAQKFNICELEFILSTMLKEGGKLHITCPDKMNIELGWSKEEKKIFRETNSSLSLKKITGEMVELGKIYIFTDSKSNKNIMYAPLSEGSSLPITVETCPYVKSSIESALMRMGLLTSPKLEELAKDMCRFDDVLIGLDTTCFYHSVTTAALLDSFVGVARYPYLDTPNWVTLVASVISTGEIEHKATESKEYFDDKDTKLTHDRRIACRALQEFMEINACADLEGVTIMLTGEIPSDINLSGRNTVRDELIRKQIINFFGKICFHKGIYFLTGDRMCAMFARTEGLHAIYLTRGKMGHCVPLTHLPPQKYREEKDIHNVSELVYELGVEFPLKITCLKEVNDNKDGPFSGLSFIIKTDWAGKSLQEWENRNFMVKFVKSDEQIHEQFFNCLKKNADAVRLGQLLWGWEQVNTRHHEGSDWVI